jgi:hypothetical protein
VRFQSAAQCKLEIKKGCGFDEQEVILVDYPKFYTNNDGYKDYWHIVGIEKFPMQLLLFLTGTENL